MFCFNCGKNIADDIKFCPHCGARTYIEAKNTYPPMDGPVGGYEVVPAAVVEAPAEVKEPLTMRSGLVCAIIFTALSTLFWNVLGIITGVLGIIFAAMTKSACKAGDAVKAKSRRRVSKTMNITTIVLFVLWIVMFVALIVFAAQLTAEAATVIQESDVVNMSAVQLQEFLSEYGYNYDLEVIEDYLHYTLG